MIALPLSALGCHPEAGHYVLLMGVAEFNRPVTFILYFICIRPLCYGRPQLAQQVAPAGRISNVRMRTNTQKGVAKYATPKLYQSTARE